jgi:hypothetical protein
LIRSAGIRGDLSPLAPLLLLAAGLSLLTRSLFFFTLSLREQGNTIFKGRKMEERKKREKTHCEFK